MPEAHGRYTGHGMADIERLASAIFQRGWNSDIAAPPSIITVNVDRDQFITPYYPIIHDQAELDRIAHVLLYERHITSVKQRGTDE